MIRVRKSLSDGLTRFDFPQPRSSILAARDDGAALRVKCNRPHNMTMWKDLTEAAQVG